MEELRGFETYLLREERSENTISCYLRDIRQFFIWFGKDVRDISELDLIAYKRFLGQKEKTVITANRKLASVNAFCRYLYDARRIPEAYAVKLTKNRDKPEYKGLAPEECRRLRQHILDVGNPMHVCMVELLMATGIRVSELCGLTMNDLRLAPANPAIRVQIGRAHV